MTANSMIETLQWQQQQRATLSDVPSVAIRLATSYIRTVGVNGINGISLIAWQSKISSLNPALAVTFTEKVREYRSLRRTSLRRSSSDIAVRNWSVVEECRVQGHPGAQGQSFQYLWCSRPGSLKLFSLDPGRADSASSCGKFCPTGPARQSATTQALRKPPGLYRMTSGHACPTGTTTDATQLTPPDGSP